jgi:hypothetical protein
MKDQITFNMELILSGVEISKASSGPLVKQGTLLGMGKVIPIQKDITEAAHSGQPHE